MRRASSPDAKPDLMSGWEEEHFLNETRRIHIVGDIDDCTAEYAIQRLQRFARDGGDPVHMYISSYGGMVDAGYAIIDAMLLMPGPVTTIITGRAYSMAAVIAAYGTHGRRHMTPHSTAMLHPTYFGMGDDYVEQQQRQVAFTRQDWERKVASLARQMKQPAKKLLSKIDKGLWLDADAAIRERLVDSIWTPQMEAAVNAVARRNDTPKGRLAQVGQILAIVADGIHRGEDFDVERSG